VKRVWKYNNNYESGNTDQTVDESSWVHRRYGKASKGLVSDIINKLDYNRGRQIIISMNSDRIRPRAFTHWHKLHHNPDVFTVGKNEIRIILEKLNILLAKGKFKEELHLTVDNYFSGDKIMKYLGMKFIYITLYY